MPKENELTQNEVNKEPVSITKTRTEEQQQNLSTTRNMPLQQNLMSGNGGEGPILNTAERVEVGPASRAAHVEEPARPEYISFDEAYIRENRNDNGRMRAVRSSLKIYMDLKRDLQTVDQENKQLYLEKMINELLELRRLCDSYSFFRFSLFASEAKKKQEIRQVREQAEQELERVRQDYFTHLENEFQTRAYANPSIKQRESKKTRQPRKIGLGAKKSGKQRILLDELNKQVTLADYAVHSVKSYLKQRSFFDLRQNRLDFTEEEKGLLLKIQEYGRLAPVERELGRANGLWACIYTIPKLKSRQKKEQRLYQEIRRELTRLTGKESELTEEKKVFFRSYLDRLENNTKGTLTLTDEQKNQVHDEITGVRYARTSKQMDDGIYTGAPLPQKMVDHRGEPLFSHPPTTADVIQSEMGNCFFLCAVGEMVSENPETVTDMFQEEGDNVIVRLWHHDPKNIDADPKPVFIKIDKMVDDYANKGALWVSLLCKAFCSYNRIYPRNLHMERMKEFGDALQIDHQRRKVINYGYFSRGGVSSDVYPILTGRKKESTMGLKGTAVETGVASHMMKLAYQKEHRKEDRTKMEQDHTVLDQEVAVFSVEGHGDVVYIRELCGDLLQRRKSGRQALFDEIKQYKKDFAELKERKNKAKTETEKDRCIYESQELTSVKLQLVRKYNAFMGEPGVKVRPGWSKDDNVFDEDSETAKAAEADKVFLAVFSKLSEVISYAGGRYAEHIRHWDDQKQFFQMVAGYLKRGAVTRGALNEQKFQLTWCAEQLGMDETELFDKLLDYAVKTNEMAAEKYDELKNAPESEIFTGVYSEYALSVFDRINELKGQGFPVSAGGRVGVGETTANGETKGAGVVGQHGYSVLGTTEILYEGKPIKMIRLRNPWGHYTSNYVKDTKTGKVEAVTNEESGGEFLCELTHFIKTFDQLFTTR